MTAKKISKSEVRKIRQAIPSVKPDKIDDYLIEEAKRINDGTSKRCTPSLFK